MIYRNREWRERYLEREPNKISKDLVCAFDKIYYQGIWIKVLTGCIIGLFAALGWAVNIILERMIK